eukprot:SAG11_NODE_741_length_7412_cov_5.844250_1_plen_44_part_00
MNVVRRSTTSRAKITSNPVSLDGKDGKSCTKEGSTYGMLSTRS